MRKEMILVVDQGKPVIQNARFVRVGIEPTGEREHTYCLYRCSFAAMPNEMHKALSPDDLKELLHSFYKDGLELIVTAPATEKLVKHILETIEVSKKS